MRILLSKNCREHLIIIMACTVHYDDYVDPNDQLLHLEKDGYERLVFAAACRRELGGGSIHELQSSQIPKQLAENILYHSKCYKKFTSAIGIANRSGSSTVQTSTRVRRSGDLGSTLRPPYCMFCLKATPKTVNRKTECAKTHLAKC